MGYGRFDGIIFLLYPSTSDIKIANLAHINVIDNFSMIFLQHFYLSSNSQEGGELIRKKKKSDRENRFRFIMK